MYLIYRKVKIQQKFEIILITDKDRLHLKHFGAQFIPYIVIPNVRSDEPKTLVKKLESYGIRQWTMK